MGKIRRRRQKFHNTVKTSNNAENEISKQKEFSTEMEDVSNSNNQILNTSINSNVFSNITITNDILNQKLPDFDRLSTKSLKSLNSQLTKKEKRLLKHELFIQKIDAIKVAKQKEKEKNRRKKHAVVGDMKTLADALPTLELLMKQNKDVKNEGKQKKPLASRSAYSRQKAMVEDIAAFHQIRNHPSFRSDPFGTIKTHLSYKLKNEGMDT